MNYMFDVVKTVTPFHTNVNISHEELHEIINDLDVDIVVSMLYPRILKEPVISTPKFGCINFHPAPLPKYPGVAPYVRAIMEEADEWGATAHFIDEGIDTGDILEVKTFPINHKSETSLSLKAKTQTIMEDMFARIMKSIYNNKFIQRSKQKGHGEYFSAKDFENMREIKDTDDINTIDKKIRAFWCPPFNGAYIKRDGIEYTLVSEDILKRI